MEIPKVFISYSHDSQEHKKWVLDFAVRLRNSGIDAILDQWELKPGDDLPHFMEKNLAASDRVLMICTETYVHKANSGVGGVGYEKMIVTSDMLKTIDSNKVIPIIRQTGTQTIPTFLKTKLYLDFSRDDQNEFNYDELIRTLHGAALFEKPPVGNNPFTSVQSTPPERTGDSLRELMRMIVEDFESHSYEYVRYPVVVAKTKISRILLDTLIAQAIREGLLQQDSAGDLYLTDNGKLYAIQHKLIRS